MKRVVIADGARIEYVLIQTARRDILIQVPEGGAVRVYAPKTARLAGIDALVRKHAPNILAMAEKRKLAPLRNGDFVSVEGTPRRVEILPGRPGAELTADCLRVWVKDVSDDEAARAQARACLSEWTLRRVRERIAYYLPRTGGEFGRVTVRSQRSRWGSCSSKHNLNFNWKLILAPKECLDYVVIHELCHLTEFNHSPRFWKLVEAQMPDYRVWKEYLKTNGASLIL